MSAIPHFTSILEYNTAINIPGPELEGFDIRSFEDNMACVPMRMEPFRIPFFQLAILETGTGQVNSDGDDYDLDNCTLFFNLPGQIIYWHIEPDWKGYYCCIEEGFYGVRLPDYPQLAALPYLERRHPGIHLERHEALELIESCRRIHSLNRCNETHARTLVQAELAAVLAYCLRYFEQYTAEEARTRVRRSLGQRFRGLVNEHVNGLALGLETENKRPGEYARALFVSPGHLADAVRRELDTTPTALINERRIQESQKLLATTSLPLNEIASQLGFSSLAYFSRLFSKIIGCSPSAWRNEC